MASAAFLYEHGERKWAVRHDSERGIYDLTVDGHPPELLSQIHAQLKTLQDNAGGADANVDYIFDVPLELAAKLCGYRHDRWQFEWGEPSFTRLVPVKA